MAVAAQLLMNGLIAGSIYALVAVGFTLAYSVAGFMHFAHGAAVTVSAFIFYALYELAAFPFWLAIVTTVLAGGVFGVVLNQIYRPMRLKDASNAVMLIVSIALFIFFQNLMLAIFGADIKTIDFGTVQEGMNVLGATVTGLQLVIIAASVALLVGFWLFMQKTRMGTALRAVADSTTLAETVGIDKEYVYNVTFALATAVAAVASILIGMEQNIEPNMGLMLIIRGFTGSIVGGITSVPGAVLGSYLLGFVENIGIWYLPSGYKDAIAFFVLFLFLLFKPQGIMGKEVRE